MNLLVSHASEVDTFITSSNRVAKCWLFILRNQFAKLQLQCSIYVMYNMEVSTYTAALIQVTKALSARRNELPPLFGKAAVIVEHRNYACLHPFPPITSDFYRLLESNQFSPPHSPLILAGQITQNPQIHGVSVILSENNELSCR